MASCSAEKMLGNKGVQCPGKDLCRSGRSVEELSPEVQFVMRAMQEKIPSTLAILSACQMIREWGSMNFKFHQQSLPTIEGVPIGHLNTCDKT